MEPGFPKHQLDLCKNCKACDIEKGHKEEAAGTQGWKKMELLLLKMVAKVYRKISKPGCGEEAYVPGSMQQSKHKKWRTPYCLLCVDLQFLLPVLQLLFLTASVCSLNQTPTCSYTTVNAIVRVINS